MPQVVDVVPGKHAHDVFDRFLPAFGMQPVVLPLLGVERSKQREIPFPQHAKLLDRFLRMALVIMSAGDPLILIVCDDVRTRGAKNQPHPEGADDFSAPEAL